MTKWHPARVCSAHPCKRCANKPSLSTPTPAPDPRLFSVTAGLPDTRLIVCCLIWALQVWTDLSMRSNLLSMAPVTLLLVFNYLWERAFMSLVQEKQKLFALRNIVTMLLWAQSCFHWWTRSAIVEPFVVLSEPRGNRSDFCPALGPINRQGMWTEAPRIFHER